MDKFITPQRKIRPQQQRPIPCSWTNTKRCPFHHRGLGCKSKMSSDTWNNRQVWPWSTKWSRAKVNPVLKRECTGHRKHTLPTTQEMILHMKFTRWSIPKSGWLHLQLKMEKLHTVSKNKTWSWLWLNHKLIVRFKLKLKNVWKTTRPLGMT